MVQAVISTLSFKWYQTCSLLLLDTLTDGCEYHSCLEETFHKLVEFRSNYTTCTSLRDSNALIIAVQGAVFTFLAKVVAKNISQESCKENVEPTSSPAHEVLEEPSDVYFRFGGAAIAEMLHNRYRTIYTSPHEKRSIIASEINLIKAIQCQDKSTIPASLKYRDRGYMYFPEPSFIPFIKEIDTKVRQIANNDGIQQHGKNIVQVATNEINKARTSLKEQFETILLKKIDSLDGMENIVTTVYNEFTRKLYNTRLGEFMDSYRQSQVAKQGSATLAGQNLRDTLLTHHVNIKNVM